MNKLKLIYLWIIMCSLSLLILICFGAYSFAKPDDENKTIVTNNLKITYNPSSEINEVINPGWKKEVTFTVENISEENITFKLRWSNMNNKITNKESFVNSLKTDKETLLNEEIVLDSAVDYPIVENITIGSKEKKEFTYIIEYKKEDYNQQKDVNKTFKGNLEIVLQNKQDGYLKNNPVYKITYNLNGGYLEEENPITYTNETPTFILNNPKKLGYNFNGWSTKDSEATSLQIIQKGSEGNKVFTANFEPIIYEVKFNSNGGTGEMQNMKLYYDEEYKLSKNKFKKEGSKFIGWSLTPNGEATYKNQEEIINLTDTEGVINLYAVWK